MNRINILDEKTINKIAAGEVVKNPASVIKELLENSIDAEASAITVEIAGGGIKRIRITDSGNGINREQLTTAFMRHATSKISTARDLFNISTLGFRGEALSSISAVSMLEIKTKTHEAEVGSYLKINGGKFEEIKDIGLPKGTTIIVSNLFFNTPARLKFLKSASAETGYITEIVAKFILAYPEVSFTYISNGETIFVSPGNGSLEEALIAVYREQILDKVKFFSQAEGDIAVSGYIGLPQFALKNRRHQSFFVNRRYVKNSFLSECLSHAYGERILKGHFHFAVLFVEMKPEDLDVNVHPEKLEVKFSDEQKIDYAIAEAVNACLKSVHITGNIVIKAVEAKEVIEPTAQTQVSPETNFYSGFAVKLKQESDINHYTIDINPKDFDIKEEGEPEEKIQTQIFSEEEKESIFGSYKITGTLFDTYLLLEQKDVLLLIDQHAAHERVLYNQLLSDIESKDVTVQYLLDEEIVDVSGEETDIFEKNSKLFYDLGFEAEMFSQNKLKVTAVPLIINANVQELLEEMFLILRHTSDTTLVLKREKLISAMCRKAIKANYKLSDDEIKFLLNEYKNTGEYPTCPHGRPIVSVLSKTQIEKGFSRRV